jgi:hypothetical protein
MQHRRSGWTVWGRSLSRSTRHGTRGLAKRPWSRTSWTGMQMAMEARRASSRLSIRTHFVIVRSRFTFIARLSAVLVVVVVQVGSSAIR